MILTNQKLNRKAREEIAKAAKKTGLSLLLADC
jgi:hypothetical protein